MCKSQVQEVYRGSLDECLEHLSKTDPTPSVIKKMAKFCSVNPDTVKRWLSSKKPEGENRLKLICCLSVMDYTVIEWERLEKIRCNIGELIGFGVMSLKVAAGLVGYVRTNHFSSAVLRSNETRLSIARKTAMQELVIENRQALKVKRQRASSLFFPKSRKDKGIHQKPTSPKNWDSRRKKAVVKILEATVLLLDDEGGEE